MCLIMALASGCGRSSLEPESLDGGPTSSTSTSSSSGVIPGTCNPTTCSNGCCDSKGVCQTGRNVRSCGSVGAACTDCVAAGFDTCTDSRVCGRNDPGCGPASCAGCCNIDPAGNIQCLSGTEGTACGRSGSTCINCEDEGAACDLSTRTCGTTRCDATNCNGCCVGDLCLPGDSTLACGANGGQCGRCGSNQVCRITASGGGRCEGISTCGPENCKGCCTASGLCRSGETQSACGSFGTRCDACSANEVCTFDPTGQRLCRRTSTCGPDNCAGCCAGDTCILGTSELFCGIKGQQCQTCGKGQFCNPAGGFCDFTPTCNAATCFGCCIGDICAVGSQNTACGFNGQQCQNCANQGPGLTCQSGICQQPTCGPFTCPTGCCLGNTCVTGTQDKACGGGFFPFPFDGGPVVGGQQCVDCTLSNQTCIGQQCQTTCNAATCPNGCCSNGICVPGNSNFACGSFGKECTFCGPNETCNGQACQSTCGPSNCNGCCNANGICVSGIASSACGAGGQQCDNCTADGSFCNGLVIPRRCNNDQSTCPAPYGSCPASVALDKTDQRLKSCDPLELDAIAAACANNPTGALCLGALSAVKPECQTCMTRFNHPFARNTGLFACAAGFIDSNSCRRSLGCATDCASDSCETCTPGTQTQCFTLVNGVGGQCRAFANATTCANAQLTAGQLCSQFSYSDYGEWLRSVGNYYCATGL